MLNLFISHAWNDLSNASLFEFTTELEKDYALWLDVENIKPGDVIRQKISDGIAKADVVLLLLSENCLHRPDIYFEIETAISLSKKLVPCILDESGYKSLKNIQATFFDNASILFIDFYKEALGFNSGFLNLRQFLLEIELSELNQSQEAADLLEKNTRLSNLLARMQFVRARQISGTSGNASTNTSILMMAHQMRSMFEADMSNPLSYQYILLSEAIENLVTLYPDPSQNAERTLELQNSILRIDPHKKNPIFQQFMSIFNK